MKYIIQIALCISMLMASQPAEAQIFKKIKEAITGEKQAEPTVPGEKLSGSDLQFENWDLGEVEIVTISTFADDYDKYQEQVGSIQSDGSFSITWPNEVKTWMQVSAYKKSCIDSENATIKPESMGVINEVAKIMKQHADLSFRIDGHTDSDGSDEHNLQLSEKRAAAVKNVLVDLGISKDRLQTKGMGESAPVMDNTTEEGKANNRRVEFIKL